MGSKISSMQSNSPSRVCHEHFIFIEYYDAKKANDESIRLKTSNIVSLPELIV